MEYESGEKPGTRANDPDAAGTQETGQEPPEGISSRKARIIARAILTTVGLLAGLLACELVIRVAAPQQLILLRPDFWQPADTVGWVHRPHVDTRINTGERTVSVFTDAEGFRVGADGPVADGREVLLLGDSYIEAIQVEYEESAAGLLEAMLTESVGGPVAVRNAAVGGWDPDQYLLHARNLLAVRDYDVVVTALYMGNDIIGRRREYLPPREPLSRRRLRVPDALSYEEFIDAWLRPINDFFEVRSHLYLFFRNRLQTVRMEVGLAPLSFPVQFLKSEANTTRWEVTAEICGDIAELAEQHGATALFVLLPTPFQVNQDRLNSYVEGYDLDINTIDLEQPNRIVGDAFAARGLEFLDVLQAYRSAHESGQQLFGSVDPHYTPEGNELLAGLIAPWVAPMLRE